MDDPAPTQFLILAQSRTQDWKLRPFGPFASWEDAVLLLDELREKHPLWAFSIRAVHNIDNTKAILG